jgi:hypothetical protein
MGLMIRADDYLKCGRSNDTINNGSEAVPVEEIEYDNEQCIECRGGKRSNDNFNDS